jgi:MscS family membrane protein
MFQLPAYFYQVYFGNTLLDYCWLAGFVLLGFIFERFLSKILSNILFNTISKYSEGISNDKFFQLLHKPLSWLVMLIILYLASSHIEFPEEWDFASKDEFGVRMLLHRFYQLFLYGSLTWIFLRIADFFTLVLLKKAEKTDTKQDDQLISFGAEITKIIIIIFSIFIILGSVFNINIGSLVAGLGIGGLALALAAKESLENLLSSFIIFFDKPFIVGDTVTVGSVTGTVEKIGFRSTRIRTLEKSYLTLPNKKMIDAELDNLSLRTFRRVKFDVGVTYGTSVEQIKAIVKDIQQYIDEHPNTNQDGKVRFFEFGSSSLNILVLYFIDTMDYGVFLEVKEEINFKIMEIVTSHGSDFAFPTQTIHLEQNNK